MAVKLTKADHTILSEIEFNPRITANQLAKICRLSKDTIRYRIKRLEQLKIIVGYSSIIDHKKLGFQSYKLYIRLNTTKETRKKLIEFLRQQPNIFAIFESTGNWDIATAQFFRNHFEYRAFEKELLADFGDAIIERRFCTMIEAELYERKENNYKTHTIWGDVENYKIDQKDIEILDILYTNASESLVNIAQKIELSIDAIRKRITQLEEKKIISFMKTKINYEKLGFETYKILIFPKVFSDEEKIISYIRHKKIVINSIRTIGPWNIEVEAKVNKYGEIEQLLFDLNETFLNQIEKFEVSVFKNEELFFNKKILE